MIRMVSLAERDAFYKGELLRTPNGIFQAVWSCQRPRTHGWGSGEVWNRIIKHLGRPDVAFGKTDGIPDDVLAIDHNTGYEWANLPFSDNYFEFGYWDPPYDRLYKHEGQEIWRVCRRLAILHTHIWPISWLKDAEREAVIAITMGPMKRIRCLQVFKKTKQGRQAETFPEDTLALSSLSSLRQKPEANKWQ